MSCTLPPNILLVDVMIRHHRTCHPVANGSQLWCRWAKWSKIRKSRKSRYKISDHQKLRFFKNLKLREHLKNQLMRSIGSPCHDSQGFCSDTRCRSTTSRCFCWAAQGRIWCKSQYPSSKMPKFPGLSHATPTFFEESFASWEAYDGAKWRPRCVLSDSAKFLFEKVWARTPKCR